MPIIGEGGMSISFFGQKSALTSTLKKKKKKLRHISSKTVSFDER